MRRMDWLMLAVIATFLVGAAMAEAIDWAAGGLAAAGRGEAGQTLVSRLISVGAGSPILRQPPTIFRRS